MPISELARLCIVGSDKGGTATLAREDSPTGAALRELEALPRREGGDVREETARKCLLASGIAMLRLPDVATPQPEAETTAPVLEESLPEGPDPRALFTRRYPYEVLTWLHRCGRRLPNTFLPEAVQWATTGRHDIIWPVLGRAGVQLCRDNPSWRRLLADCAVEAAKLAREEDLPSWEHASPDVRCLLLRRLRARDPRAGRELALPLLQRQFLKNRNLLYAFRIGLSAEDIPLLEECSRKKCDVSGLHPAKVLLSLLPESTFFQMLAGEDILAWKKGKLVLKAGVFNPEQNEWNQWKDWMEGLPKESFLVARSLDWWVARSGRDCAELAPVLVQSDFLQPAGMRIFLEDNKDWLRHMLKAVLEEASNNGGVRSGSGFLGTLAAAMLPQEEVEGWLQVLLRHEAPDCRVCDALAAPMLLHARFPLSRELWSEYIRAIGRRAEAFSQAAAMEKDRYCSSTWMRNVTALWGAEQSDCIPEDFNAWTYREFTGTHGMNTILYHLAWKMPLDLLERLTQVLRAASDSLFGQERQELDEIRLFRAQIEQA